MTLVPLVAAAAESGSPPINPFIVGAGVLIFLSLLVLALLSFGAGREHS
jgi:hypothetical protein